MEQSPDSSDNDGKNKPSVNKQVLGGFSLGKSQEREQPVEKSVPDADPLAKFFARNRDEVSDAAFKKSERSDDAVSASESDSSADHEAHHEQPELSPTDIQYAAAKISQERLAELPDVEAQAKLPIDEQKVVQNAREFHERIVENAQPPAESLQTGLTALEAEASNESDKTDESVPADEIRANNIDTLDAAPAPVTIEANNQDEANEDDDPNMVSAGGSGSGSGGRRTPPSAPSSSPPPGPGLPPRGTTTYPYPVGIAVPRASVAPSPYQAPRTEYVRYYDRSRAFSDMLVGGIVGYFIGRKRGRIKTEQRLLPVQKKLEREVKDLQQDIAQKEQQIRTATREKFYQDQELETTKTAVKTERAKVNQEVKISRQADVPKQEALIIDHEMDRHKQQEEQQPARRPAVEAQQIHGSALAVQPEQIGHMLVAAEAITTTAAEGLLASVESAQKPTQETKDTRSIERQVETMSRNELMILSEKVQVEGSTLRQVYETHLISERGLRRLVGEYLRGGDVIKAFRRELIEKEIDFERDPKLRDQIRNDLDGGGASSQSLHTLLSKAGVDSESDNQTELAQARAKDLSDARRQAKKRQQRQIMDVSLITIITVLSALIIVIVLKKI